MYDDEVNDMKRSWLLSAGVSEEQIDTMPGELIKKLYQTEMWYGPNGNALVQFADSFTKDRWDHFHKLLIRIRYHDGYYDFMHALTNVEFGEGDFAFMDDPWHDVERRTVIHLAGSITSLGHSTAERFMPEYQSRIRFTHERGQGLFEFALWALLGDGTLPEEWYFEKARRKYAELVRPYLHVFDPNLVG